MDYQRYYEVAYVVQETQEERPEQILRHFFMRTGKRETLEAIYNKYSEIKYIAETYGYTNPLHFLEDEFREKINYKIPVYGKQLDLTKLKEFFEGASASPKQEAQSEWPSPEHSPMRPVPDPSVIIEQNSKCKRPSKKQVPLSNDERIERDLVPEKVKARIVKSKRKSKVFKDMDGNEKEQDNRFDGFVYLAQHEDRDATGESIEESVPDNSPFASRAFGSLDIEFRKLMHRVYIKEKSQAKDKTGPKHEMALLKEYFEKKLGIEEKEDLAGKKLALAISGLMKKLQDRIFLCEDRAELKLLVSVKNKLCNYYNFNKK